MKALHRMVGLAVLALALVGAAPADEIEDLVRQGNAAYVHRDYDQALRLYEQAEKRTTDPGLVAFNKGAALYRMGRYTEAEQCYRCSLDDREAPTPRRLRALYDLGTSLLQVENGKDAHSLVLAIRCLRQCRRQTTDPDLRARARHNLELARRLLALVVPDPSNPGDQPKSDEEPPGAKKRDDEQPGESGDPTQQPGRPDKGGQAILQDPSKGTQKAIETKENTPGKGNLGTLPDTDELTHLDAQDTAEHLKRATGRIRKDQHEQRRAGVHIFPNVKDW